MRSHARCRTARRSASDAAVPVVDGRHQWLHAAWHRRVAGILADVFAAGRALAGRRRPPLRGSPAWTASAAAAVHDADRPEDLPGASVRGRPVELLASAPCRSPPSTSPRSAQELDGGAPLFDVRQPDEYEEARAPGAALVPLAEVPERIGEFPTDRTVYVICKSGGRSAKAVEHLRANGVDAVNVDGGTMAWIEAGNAVDRGA